MWVLGLGILYSIGINLSRKKSRLWLSISFIGVLMNYAYMDALIFDAGRGGDPVASFVEILIVATLILAMVKWGNPQT